MKKIKELREEAGISQKELSQSINSSQASISKWEVNQLSISGSNLKKLAMYFKVSADDLLGNKLDK